MLMPCRCRSDLISGPKREDGLDVDLTTGSGSGARGGIPYCTGLDMDSTGWRRQVAWCINPDMYPITNINWLIHTLKRLFTFHFISSYFYIVYCQRLIRYDTRTVDSRVGVMMIFTARECLSPVSKLAMWLVDLASTVTNNLRWPEWYWFMDVYCGLLLWAHFQTRGWLAERA